MHQSSVEQAQERVKDLRSKLREEVTAEVQANLKRRVWRGRFLRCGGCCGLYAITLLVIPAIVLVLIAKTGIIEIPVVSARIAHTSAPTRVVEPAGRGDAMQVFTAKAQDVVRRGAGASEARVVFTEGELSHLVREAFRGQGGVWADIGAHAQVVVLPGALELFARTPGVGGAMTTVRITATPTIVDQRLVAEVREARVGAMRIPRMIINRSIGALIARVPPLTIAGGGAMPAMVVAGIELVEGRATLIVRRAGK